MAAAASAAQGDGLKARRDRAAEEEASVSERPNDADGAAAAGGGGEAAPAPSPAASRAFRDALGMFATGVTVVSTPIGAGPGVAGVGITVNSFTSVSLDPPLVLWCIGKDSQRYSAFRDAAGFAVNVLSAAQEALARRFTTNPDIHLDDPGFARGPAGVVWLEGAAARFACETVARHPGGDHLILVGRVIAFEHGPPSPLLGYRRGGFVTIA